MNQPINNSPDPSAPTASAVNPSSLEAQISIVAMFCDGMTTREVAHALGLTTSQVNNAFVIIREKACLPHERKTYQACAADVNANMRRYHQYLDTLAELAVRYNAAQIRFKF